MYAVGPGGTLARNQGLCQSYVSAKILMHMTHVICCLSRMKSQWWFFFFLGGGGGFVWGCFLFFFFFFFEFISKGCLQLVSFTFLSESTIADGISETSWQELYLVSKLKIILEEGIL